MRRKKLPALLLALIMAVSLAVPACAADDVKPITVLQTSDLHGMVNPFDYAANKESKTSLAHAAAIITAERKADPDLLLVFVTSSPEYVWDAFPVHPFDYLLKPYREEKLFQLADELRRVLELGMPL